MAQDKLIESIHIVDNGVRCFVPPCFMYDLINKENTLVAMASLIDSEDQVDLNKSALVQQCVDKSVLVDGVLVEYTEQEGGPPSKGVKFVIHRIHK